MRNTILGLIAGLLLLPAAAAADASACFGTLFGAAIKAECKFSTTGTHWVDLDSNHAYTVTIWETITATSAAIVVELYDCADSATVHTDTSCRLLRTASQTQFTGLYPADEWENVRATRLIVRVVTHAGSTQTSRIRIVQELN